MDIRKVKKLIELLEEGLLGAEILDNRFDNQGAAFNGAREIVEWFDLCQPGIEFQW